MVFITAMGRGTARRQMSRSGAGVGGARTGPPSSLTLTPRKNIATLRDRDAAHQTRLRCEQISLPSSSSHVSVIEFARNTARIRRDLAVASRIQTTSLIDIKAFCTRPWQCLYSPAQPLKS